MWQYYVRESGNKLTALNYNTETNRWEAPSGKGDGYAEAGVLYTSERNYCTVAQFVAPRAGSVTVSFPDGITLSSTSNKGVQVSIFKDGTSNALFENKDFANGTTSVDSFTLDVTEGQKITFWVRNVGGDTTSENTVKLNPTITYPSSDGGEDDAEEKTVYSFSEDYQTKSSTTGVWRYYVREAVSNQWTALNYNDETGRWEAPSALGTAYIWKGGMHPSGANTASAAYQTVLRFVAPRAGRLTVSFPDGITVDSNSADGVTLSFWADGTSDQRFNTVLYSAGNTAIDTYTVDVREGQELNFLLHCNGNTNGDTTSINPTITYSDVYSFAGNYQTTSADTGVWRYYTRNIVTNVFTPMVYSNSNGRWQAASGEDALIWKGGMHTGSGTTQTVAQFVAPKAGTVEVTVPGGITVSNAASDGVKYSFWAKNFDDQRINGQLCSVGTTAVETFTIDVEEGEKLNFMLHCNGNNAEDATGLNPTITYTVPEELETYSFVDGYKTDSSTAGMWRYYIREVVKNKFTPLVYNETESRWEAPEGMGTAYVWKGAMHPSGTAGADFDYQTVVQFVAPKNGTVTVSFPGGITVADAGSDGVKLSFWADGTSDQRFNSVVYQPGTTQIASQTVEVKKGQKLNFLLHRNGNNAGDTTGINPTITYNSITEDDPVDTTPSCVTLSFYNEDTIDYGVSWITPDFQKNPVIQVVEKTSGEPDFTNATEYAASSISFEISSLKHTGVITGLAYDTTYYYRVGDSVTDTWSKVGEFTTKEEDVEEVKFVQLTDTHDWNHSLEAALNDNTGIDFVLHTGDFVNSTSSTSEDWANMLDTTDAFMKVALQNTAGNHDPAEYSGEYFNIKYEPDSLGRIYYSFNYGDVHFVVLDTGGTGRGSDETINDEQMEWLIDDLENSDAKWTIIGMHKSIYSVGPHGAESDVKTIREQLVPIMDKYEVDLVLSGHDHVYMRTPVMKDGKPDYSTSTITEVYNGTSIQYDVSPDGTVYIIPGASGLKQYSRSTWDDAIYYDVTDNIMKPVYAVISIKDETLTYCLYTVDETTYKSTLYDTYGIIKEEEEAIASLKSYSAKDMGEEWSYLERTTDPETYQALTYDKESKTYTDQATGAVIDATSQTTTNSTNTQTVRKFTAPYSGKITIAFENNKAASSDPSDLAYLRVWRGSDRQEEVYLKYLDNSTTRLSRITLDVEKGEELYFVVGSLSDSNTTITVTPVVHYLSFSTGKGDTGKSDETNSGTDSTQTSEKTAENVTPSRTGDSNAEALVMWLAVFALAAGGVGVSAVRRRKYHA